MNNLPEIVLQKNLRHYWWYRNAEGKPFALVTRYDGTNGNGEMKKRFHQYHLNSDGMWIEGAPTPPSIFGIDTLSKTHSEQIVNIFEGEKSTAAAQTMGLSALTSMMGSSQGQHADWAILAEYRHVKEFVLYPDNDDVGIKYMQTVYHELKKACPDSEVSICRLPSAKKGDDIVDWIQTQKACPLGWDGFSLIDEPYSEYLRSGLETYVIENKVSAQEYFSNIVSPKTQFDIDPEPIEDVLCEVQPCPLYTLPQVVVKWIQGLAEQMQIPVDYLTAPLLVYVGSLIGRKRALMIRPGTDWTEHPNLWGMLVGRPSVMKSPAMKVAIKPLLALAEQADKEYEEALKQFSLDSEEWKIRTKACDEIYKHNIKDSLSGKKQETSIPPRQFRRENAPQEPKRKRYKTNDSTIEKLGELLIENPQGLLLWRDELAGWLYSFEKLGRENDRQFFLESWTGKEDFDVDRISRGSLHIPALCLSIFGGIQPGPLSQYVRSAIKGGKGDDGFIQRFQIIVWPDVKPEWELITGVAITHLEAPIRDSFAILDQLPFGPNNQPITIPFSIEAQQLFDEWQGIHEMRIRKEDLPPHFEAHLAKFKKLIPALCLILEHLKEAVEGHHPDTINLETLKGALLWGDYFESHALRVYGSGANAVPKAAKILIQRIRNGEVKEPFTIRDVYHKHHWSGLATPEEVEEVIEYLQEKHYLAAEVVNTGGRPTKKYWMNPKIFED